MPTDHVSFLQNITGSVAVFLVNCGVTSCPATLDGIVSIIASLSRYQEEGQRLHPKIILTENIREIRMLLPKCEAIYIGSGGLTTATYEACLKKCSPLARGDWHIYAERTSRVLNYGLIRTGDSAISASPEQLVKGMQTGSVSTPVVVIREIADGVVEAISHSNNSLCIAFTGRELHVADRRPRLDKLYRCISNGCQQEIRMSVRRFLDRAFGTALYNGHGMLAIVLDSSSCRVPNGLKDGNWLDIPLDIALRIGNEVRLQDTESTASTRAAVDAVAGMLMSDGIVAFDTAGHVRGFNIFARASNQTERNIMATAKGGARSRTYQLLNSWLSPSMVACMMVSQDGATAFAQHEEL